jgi:predicted DNA-binding transcriptional regulator AlpA
VKNQLSPSVPPDRLISEKTTAEILGISRDTLRRLGQRGKGPQRRKISQRRVGYKISEVEAYRDGTVVSGAEAKPPHQPFRRRPSRHRSRARS